MHCAVGVSVRNNVCFKSFRKIMDSCDEQHGQQGELEAHATTHPDDRAPGDPNTTADRVEYNETFKGDGDTPRDANEDPHTTEDDTKEILLDGKPISAEFSEPEAPDGGYGWFVVLGCFLSHVLNGGLERCDGVFYLQFLSKYGHGAQLTAWPGAVVSTIRLFLGPAASAVCNLYSVRTSVMCGGLLMTVGCILNGFAPNFYFLFFSHAFVSGVGRGFTYAPGIFILGMYFNKKRGLAAGLGSSGVGVGTFLIVPLAQYLFDEYGFEGAFLIMGGISFHMLLIAMMYRPLSMNAKFKRNHLQREKKKKTPIDVDHEESFVLVKVRKAPHTERPNLVRSTSRKSVDGEERMDVSDSITSKKAEGASQRKVKRETKKNCLKSSLKICFPKEYNDKSGGSPRRIFHFYLLKNWSFLMYCISIGLFTMAFKAAFTFIPALVKSKGIPQSQAALVLSITGVLDTVGRIAAGALFDLPGLRRIRPFLYNVVMFAVAGVAFVLPSLSTFPAFCAVCGVYGMLTGAYVSQKSVITVDILGATHVASSFGILIFFQGLGTLLGPPLSGALKDHFGNYDEAFYLGGGCMYGAAIFMIVSNIFLRIQRRNMKKRQVHEIS
ncbi:unnamed protein product [Lymnaea stagnalis]|uniref:Major facilitator superfamily (MFS) profile domain-containing protein n=1 Tax=Lymnaea stagnalis TaxID=6523 RepID=A0AAV2IB67_LYMST